MAEQYVDSIAQATFWLISGRALFLFLHVLGLICFAYIVWKRLTPLLRAQARSTPSVTLMQTKYRYEEFTWPEIRDAVAQNRVAVLPVGTVEQHGPHLPLVTDVLTSTEMSRRAVEQIPEEAVLLPSVYYSFN